MCVFETWEIPEHSVFTITFAAIGERTTSFHTILAFSIDSAISIIKKARKAKKELRTRNKLKQPDKIETENRKPGTCTLNKWPLRALIYRTNHCCQSIIQSNTNSSFSPCHYFVSISTDVRWREDSMPKKPWKESFLVFFYEEFPAKIPISRAFLEL